jgi:hypothetical protein
MRETEIKQAEDRRELEEIVREVKVKLKKKKKRTI